MKRKTKRRRLLTALCVTLGLAVLVVAMSWWTMVRMPGRSHRGALPPSDDTLASLAAELRRDVARLAHQIGERNVLNCPQELAEAADFIQRELAGAGLEVRRQEFQVSQVTCANLEAEIRGTKRPEEIQTS